MDREVVVVRAGIHEVPGRTSFFRNSSRGCPPPMRTSPGNDRTFPAFGRGKTRISSCPISRIARSIELRDHDLRDARTLSSWTVVLPPDWIYRIAGSETREWRRERGGRVEHQNWAADKKNSPKCITKTE